MRLDFGELEKKYPLSNKFGRAPLFERSEFGALIFYVWSYFFKFVTESWF